MEELPSKNYIRSEKKKPCIVCGKLTNNIEIGYERPICCSACLEEMNRKGDKFQIAFLMGTKEGEIK